MKTEPDDRAFSSENEPYEPGLSKREYFAAMAMQGMLANPRVHESSNTATDTAIEALMYADELIIALNHPAKEQKV